MGIFKKTKPTVEVRDHAIWFKHIRNFADGVDELETLRPGETVELRVDGKSGEWQRMDNGKDGRPTNGIKPIGKAKDYWHSTLQKKRGDYVSFGPA